MYFLYHHFTNDFSYYKANSQAQSHQEVTTRLFYNYLI